MIRRPPRSTPLYSSAASDVYKRQAPHTPHFCIVDISFCKLEGSAVSCANRRDPLMSDAGGNEKAPRRAGGVQSLERAFGILETMANAGGTLGLSQLATRVHLPLPTTHRFVRTLVDLGY